MALGWADLNPWTWPGQVASRFKKDTQPGGLFGPSKDQAEIRALQKEQATAANQFAGRGEAGYGGMTAEMQAQRDYLGRLARGEESLSREQLRQGLDQNRAAQQSFVASAAPRDAGMAAITGANNMGRLGYGMSGQAAMAGIAERQAANQALANMNLAQRGQDMGVALGSRQNANAALGMYKPEPGTMEKASSFLPILGGLFSDKDLKTDIKKGDDDANRAIKSLKAFAYSYKDQRLGKGKQVGIMAQDLEKAGLGHTVFDTPIGKAVDGGKLAGANTAMLAALGKRIAKLESKKKGRT